MSTDDKAFISGPITEPRFAVTPQERAWVEELDEYGWSYGDIMRQRDEARDRAEKAEAERDEARAALDRVRAVGLPGRASVWIADIRAAIEGEAT